MGKPATFKQVDVSRLLRGAARAGLPVDKYKVVVEDGRISLLPIAANELLNDAEDLERRMKDAFGE